MCQYSQKHISPVIRDYENTSEVSVLDACDIK